MGRYLALGFQMVAVTAAGAGVGIWLDGRTGKSPLFLILFFILGSIGGMMTVWRELQGSGDARR
jgi:F0F1-type ATP synthase assembly protein I